MLGISAVSGFHVLSHFVRNTLVAKSLSNTFIIFLEELPRSRISESQDFDVSAVNNFPISTGHGCALVVVTPVVVVVI